MMSHHARLSAKVTTSTFATALTAPSLPLVDSLPEGAPEAGHPARVSAMLPTESAPGSPNISGALKTPVETPEIERPPFATVITGPTVGSSTGDPSEAASFMQACLPANLPKPISTTAVSLLGAVETIPILAVNSITLITTMSNTPRQQRKTKILHKY